MPVQAAEADVEVVVLPEAPAVALQIAAEVELGRVGRDREFCRVPGIDGEFHLLGCHDRCLAKRAIEPTRHRAKVTACADEDGRRDRVVDDPSSPATLEAREARSKRQPGFRSLQ